MAYVGLYLVCGLVYWLVTLARGGESAGMSEWPRSRRIRVHAVALGLSLVVWPLALAARLARRG